MTPLLALTLGLWLGQTPEPTPSLPPDADIRDPAALEFREAWERALQNADATDEGQDFTDGAVQMPVLDVGAPGFGGAGAAGGPEDAQAQAATPATGNEARAISDLKREVEQLRAQIQALQTQLQAQHQESTARTQALEERSTRTRARAEELERMRQQRLGEMLRAEEWLVAADQALEAGDQDISDALDSADSALAEVSQSARAAGGGQIVVLIENSRAAAARALERTSHRDTAEARWHLFDAVMFLRTARRANLDKPETETVTR